ncbi:ABC transporter substrate-binding protein [Paracraurococcus ruber]|uniref:ABC transporter substrate-binding protein n=1 Tax=Paracraurococcus ruber TaxID=77675 RepID=A0ABS1D0Z8_9PROT|nr:ABC transporter substrate-binding protein [Paracraurococcus ruber]MBK1660473.1 ABC transporter substrate-binding protein [Paracraurococcus ruber]TDG27821.1 ABC transporter substrate-binding protein [Paracraurococcus ruber]
MGRSVRAARGALLLAWASLAGALPPAGGAAAQSLTMAVGAPVTSLDPHYHQLSPNTAVAQMVFDGLTGTDARARVVPGLAEGWTAVDETTWEFRLRRGVRFHNGSALTAADVAFTFQRVPNVPNSPSSYAIYTRPIREVQIVDDHTLRLRTAAPWPLLPTDLANVMILDQETHAAATTEGFNAGAMAVGTGPFRMVTHRNGERIEFERNDAYWGDRPHWQRVAYRMVTNDAARTAALLAGDVEVIDQVPTSDLAKLRGDQRLTLAEVTGLRLIFLGLDHARTDASPFVTDNDGKPLPRNPLKDARVRRALSLAIDRGAITERVMEGAAIPAGQFLPEGSFGWVPDLPVPRAEAEAAKRLLAEAGFPQGFRITLHGPNDRYPNDARIIQAIGQMWTRAGIRTTVEASPWTTFVARAGRQDLSAFLIGWGSSSGEASNPLRNLVAGFDRDKGYGASNRGRYANPELDRVVETAMRTLDDARREALLQQATRIAFEDVAIIPLHIQKNAWAMRRGLAIDARADELTRAQDVRPAAAGAVR